MITIYHNPKCSKSREGLELLELEGHPFTVVKYLEQPLDKDEIKRLITLLGIKPLELVRQKEPVWKEQYGGKKLTNAAIINALVKHPQLIERPIIAFGDTAVIARPAGKIKELLENINKAL